MHEMSLAGGILQLVEDAARREKFVRVTRLRLEAGGLAGVEARSLRFALESMVHGTCLQDALIEIDEPPGTAWCLHCGGQVEIMSRADACPACGGFQLQPTGGTELRVVEMMVQDH
ncbi:MAG: hydrogenase maturation nickel metallochaperone HypA [Burkholderiaceae bacterium]|uniref:hydrogenase maturation nickel metallochaperone HypA/HybF n=1 Tax=Polaromonas sp. TaxID=1869339 RepID=UPI0024883EDB|nr:hydrogenase maturation nickel metallochaperone HypA [Polaromonas sp.]MDI1340343.1 hydrogenase maturation nickel metallochaperone HypA [Polaromonas sp.]MDO8770700.1 hydrogenase maturation nickel metallochaperone HypA [Burkholderiaceae bacterium]